jgi:hypothetical protein
MGFSEIFVLIIVGITLIAYIVNTIDTEVEYVKSKVDGKKYLVRSLPDKQEAADLLAELNKDMMKLINHLLKKFPDNEDIQRLYKNYDPAAISEGSPDSGYTSYSINKGEKLVICIRNSDMSFVKKNIIVYPFVHELGHLMTSEVGHTPLFWKNFKFILQEAVDIGIYNKVDFKNNPTDYCSIKITSSVI